MDTIESLSDVAAGQVSTTVVEVVASAHGLSPAEVRPPLGYFVDGEALDRLFSSSSPGRLTDGVLTFWYHDCFVTVSAGGHVSVELQRAYRLSCVDCDFEAVVRGTSADTFEAAADHQSKYGRTPESHLVEFVRTDQLGNSEREASGATSD